MTSRDQIEDLARTAAAANLRIRDAVAFFESLYIADALARFRGNQTEAAQSLGLARMSLQRRTKRSENRSAGMADGMST